MKYSKIRKITKAELGTILNPNGSLLYSTWSLPTTEQLNSLQSTYTDPINVAQQQALRQQPQWGNIGTNLQTLGNTLSTIGVSTGNQYLASAGQLGTIANGAINLAQNWGNMDSSERTSGIAGLGGAALDTLDNTLFSKQKANNSGTTTAINTGFNSVANAVSMAYPVAGLAMKAGAFATDALNSLGFGTDQMTTKDQIFDSYAGKFTLAGLTNSIGAKRSKKFSLNRDTLERVGSSYGGTTKFIYDVASKANKKYGTWSAGDRHEQDANNDLATNQQAIMTRISNNNQDMLDNRSDLAYTRYTQSLNGGIQNQYLSSAKEGGKLEAWHPTISIYKEGGALTSQKNVIPEGALHARKHHMEHDSDITKKGIPVIDNKGEQQAEVERNEIIFSLEVTKKLEELHEKYREASKKEQDELATEAGKLLVYEIMHNTIDRTGLIKQCKNGGTLQTEWIPNIKLEVQNEQSE